MNPDVIRSRLMEAARRTGIEDLLNANLFRLSGGQKQLVACASSMVVKPQVHLFDEPTSNLSSESVALLRKVLLDLHASGATMVIAEHRLSYLRDIVDRVILARRRQDRARNARRALMGDERAGANRPGIARPSLGHPHAAVPRPARRG